MPRLSNLTRRRFLTISAAVGGLVAAGLPARAVPTKHWLGVALGARASIRLRHPDAERIVSTVRGEVARLEQIFSLYSEESLLARLNAAGRLDDPPFELLEVLSLCGTLHGATHGLFDPTIQPLWAMYAEHHARGEAPGEPAVSAALKRIGWADVAYSTERIYFRKPGMALTFNGIAQGYIADKVASLLRSEGLDDILVDTGELMAVGNHPDGGGWPVALTENPAISGTKRISLSEAALASSSPLGTVLDRAGTVGHILDPFSGAPAKPVWKLVTVTAPSAALADALSTAMCLMSREQIAALLNRFAQADLVHLA